MCVIFLYIITFYCSFLHKELHAAQPCVRDGCFTGVACIAAFSGIQETFDITTKNSFVCKTSQQNVLV